MRGGRAERSVLLENAARYRSKTLTRRVRASSARVGIACTSNADVIPAAASPPRTNSLRKTPIDRNLGKDFLRTHIKSARVKSPIYCAAAAAAVFCAVAPLSAQTAHADTDPVSLVNPFIGTTGDVNAFPGADVPFGMVQWSPDTTSRPPGGDYDYKDTSITGFSLTHLSGPGCLALGDFPVLPVVGDVGDPAHAAQAFSHADEQASPGYYSVGLGSPKIKVELSVTPRTGFARFAFPSAHAANILVDVSGSQAGDSDAHFSVDSPTELSGSASSGHFCGSPDEFTVFFVARFDRPMTAYGTWLQSVLRPGSARVDGPGSGGWVTFDASSNPVVEMKVGISFVSVDGAKANLAAENAGWDFERVREDAAESWRDILNRIAIDGGSSSERQIFYTALYHALLHPNIFSDANGFYMGFDGAVHRTRAGHTEYANFSGWDIYRTQIPLIALILPRETGDMMQSLVDDGRAGGWLPKWPLADTYTDAMNGDAADPVIASAYAFGARDFDAKAALQAMVKGGLAADAPPGQGWFIERPDLTEYLVRGYVANTHTNSVSPLPNAASETLEYSVDDFCIERLAQSLGDASVQRAFASRARNWLNLFDSSTGLITPRDADGAFVETPLTPAGQSGFQEGNAVQYSWLVPHDLRALFDAMGGDDRVVQRLDDFFTVLDAGAGKPYAWLGNEPSLLQPWLYLSARAPWRTQAVVRDIQTTLYLDEPAGEAGNDDLGTMSAWYVWSAIGLYPQTPGVPLLDIGSPLFTHISVRSEDGRVIEVGAPQASSEAPYVQALRFNGRPSTKTWFIVPASGATRLDFDLATTPNRDWGTGVGDGPPSWNATTVRTPPSTLAALSVTPASMALGPGESTSLTIRLTNARSREPVSAAWRLDVPDGLSVDATSGTLSSPAGGDTSTAIGISARSALAAGFYTVALTGRAANGAALHRSFASVQMIEPGSVPALAYVLNFSDASVTPIDLHSRTFGPPIVVGANPGDGAVSPDAATLYVANQGANTVSVVDTRKLAVVGTLAVGKTPAGIRITPDGKTVWVSDYADNDVRSIDTSTRAVSSPIPVEQHPEEIALSPDGATLYVVNQGSDDVTPIDVKTRVARAPIPVGRVPLGIVVSPDGKTAYVTNIGSNDVTPIDLRTGAPEPPIKVGMAPQQPAISPDGRLLLVPNSGSGTVTPIDLVTRRTKPPILVGNGPFYVMFTADGSTAYVAATGDNACVPIDMRTLRAGAPIDTGNFPIAVVR